jgi:hypothetical protein
VFPGFVRAQNTIVAGHQIVGGIISSAIGSTKLHWYHPGMRQLQVAAEKTIRCLGKAIKPTAAERLVRTDRVLADQLEFPNEAD